jgi:DNA repair ATPase RecN
MAEPQSDRGWSGNYFNYFTEVEEHFAKRRGTGLFLMSPIDWALVEAWKNAGIPLEAVLRGVDVAFEKWHERKQKRQAVNSIAYCAQAVMKEAELLTEGSVASTQNANAPFSLNELRAFLVQNAQKLGEKSGFEEIAQRLNEIAGESEQHYGKLQELDQRLTALEEKMAAIARSQQSEEQLLTARKALESELRPYRGKMTAEQLSMLERQYLDRMLLSQNDLPRLSLFYLI